MHPSCRQKGWDGLRTYRTICEYNELSVVNLRSDGSTGQIEVDIDCPCFSVIFLFEFVQRVVLSVGRLS